MIIWLMAPYQDAACSSSSRRVFYSNISPKIAYFNNEILYLNILLGVD